jgi:ABC-type uncharacterized transport system substrate-binding protein
MDDGALTKQRHAILRLAAKQSLPVVAVYRDFAQASALIAYGPDLNVLCRPSAYYVDRLCKGVVAENLPVEQSTKFDLVVNLRTAQALGLAIPSSVLLHANEIIE